MEPAVSGVETAAARAYVLGWMVALGRLEQRGVRLLVSHAGKRLSGPGPELLRSVASEALGEEWFLPPIWLEWAQEFLGVSVKDEISEDAEPRFAGLAERRAFTRGAFDASGRVRDGKLECSLELSAAKAMSAISGWFSLPLDEGCLVLEGHRALDFLGLLYDSADLYSSRTRKRYRRWAERSPYSKEARETGPDAIRFQKLHADAVAPQKTRVSDAGYDLTLIRVEKQLGIVTLFGTGLVLEPPHGFYLDVVARSSLIKTGYIVANSVGIIDPGYRGEILVPLIKLDQTAPEIALPARVVQAIVRPVTHFAVEEAKELSESGRGTGGFGSSG